jgi:hypothetical protein
MNDVSAKATSFPDARVQISGFRVQVRAEERVQGSGFRVQVRAEERVQGSGFRVQVRTEERFRVQVRMEERVQGTERPNYRSAANSGQQASVECA